MGVSVVVLQYDWLRMTMITLGIGFLIYMGQATWKSKPRKQEEGSPRSLSPKKQIAFAMSVSLLNPHALLDTVGVIGTSSLQYAGVQKAVFAAVCIGVSWLWFIALGIAGKAVGSMDTSGRLLTVINRISAVIMWGTAAYLAFGLIAGS
jgi:L-lysine exporter family protein LysE/ArgO